MVSDVYCGVGWLIFWVAVCVCVGDGIMVGLNVGNGIAIGVQGCPLRDDVRAGVIQVGRWDRSRRCRRLDVAVHREARSEDGAVVMSGLIEVVEVFLL